MQGNSKWKYTSTCLFDEQSEQGLKEFIENKLTLA